MLARFNWASGRGVAFEGRSGGWHGICEGSFWMPFPICPYFSCRSPKTIRSGRSRPFACISEQTRQRYKCRTCARRFSENHRSLNFRLKKKDPALNAKIFMASIRGLSNRSIGIDYYVSEHCVRIRLKRLAQRALVFHSSIQKGLKIAEFICFDGLENFAGSQYEPNNIHQAIGRDSLFIYDFNFAPLNRKGRMSIWQKKRNQVIQAEKGRFNPSAIRIASADIIRRLYDRKSAKTQTLTLLSDEHFQYKRAIRSDLKGACIEHVTVSSRACRNFQNILFGVNHSDLLIRQLPRSFTRETISFNKTAGAMCQRYALYMIFKNYLRPQFTKKQVRRPHAHEWTPAQHLGLCSRRMEFGDIFSERSDERDLAELGDDWRSFWQGQVPEKYERSFEFVTESV